MPVSPPLLVEPHQPERKRTQTGIRVRVQLAGQRLSCSVSLRGALMARLKQKRASRQTWTFLQWAHVVQQVAKEDWGAVNHGGYRWNNCSVRPPAVGEQQAESDQGQVDHSSIISAVGEAMSAVGQDESSATGKEQREEGQVAHAASAADCALAKQVKQDERRDSECDLEMLTAKVAELGEQLRVEREVRQDRENSLELQAKALAASEKARAAVAQELEISKRTVDKIVEKMESEMETKVKFALDRRLQAAVPAVSSIVEASQQLTEQLGKLQIGEKEQKRVQVAIGIFRERCSKSLHLAGQQQSD